MLIRLVLNPDAGKGGHEGEELRRRIENAGHRVIPLAPEGGDPQPGELIAVAGGDGTVAKAVIAYRDAGLPMTFIPLGTANNIARSFGILGFPDILKAARASGACESSGQARFLAVARITGPGLDQDFLESAGVGVLARLMREGEPEDTVPEHSLRDRRKILHEEARNLAGLLDGYVPRDYGLRIDGRDLSGPYLMVEVMNTPRTGPGLILAPDKDPGNGRFDVILVREEDRRSLEDYLAACTQDGEPPAPFTRLGAASVEIRCRPDDLHVSDKLPEGREEAVFALQCPGGRVEVKP